MILSPLVKDCIPSLYSSKPSAKQNYTFCFFSGKRRIPLGQFFTWGHAPKPPGSASPRVGSTNLLRSGITLFCFRKMKNPIGPIFYLGTRPQTPWVGFAESTNLLRSRTTLFASFSGKRRILLGQFFTWGHGTPLDPLGRLRRGLDQ
jgi:hypothetical protein